MKKLIINLNILLVFIFCSTLANAQGNLQFNRAITITPGLNYSVPSGKVLKIESINFSTTTVCIPKSSEVSGNCLTPSGFVPSTYGVYNSITYMTIANMNFRTPSFRGNPDNSCSNWFNTSCYNFNFNSITLNTPIWLDEGKTVNVHPGVADIIISALEFNIVP
jgi:hypothetical protein